VDPILKERMFGLTNSEGNHGEDVKEYYFYLDSTPTHSYMKYLYKYPQAAYPYNELVETNHRRSRVEPEYELLDTGIFDDNRYFDVFVEYAKNTPEDLLIQITVHNRGKAAAKLQLAPTLWFRNTWSWGENPQKPVIEEDRKSGAGLVIAARHPVLGERFLYCDGAEELLFTENETNNQRLWGSANASPYVKDGINDYIVHGVTAAVNPEHRGTKAAARYQLEIGPGKSQVVRLRLSETPPAALPKRNGSSVVGNDFDRLFQERRDEADEFYTSITPKTITDDQRNVMRQALAGMLWSKQYYNYPVEDWLVGDPILEPPPEHQHGRNAGWVHLASGDVISMPDKWEYPWFAAWDLAIQTLPLAMVDLDFAKNQLLLMLDARYMHPNGQVPAYEWAFGDVNPPLLGFAAWRLYILEQQQRQQKDQEFLKRVFQKLALNFTWWVNRKDTSGRNVFEGGFLGLDNIGVFDRSAPLPTGGRLEQSDGTSWMALYCLNMVEMALELAKDDPVYLDLVRKFYQHFLYIATAMDAVGENADELWDEEDGFYYDLLHLPDGRTIRLKIRSLVGLLPLVATAVMTPEELELTPYYSEGIANFFRHHPKLAQNISSLEKPGVDGRRLASVLNEDKLRRILARMLDESEFLSDYGIRAISHYHKDHPYSFWVGDQEFRVDYEPAESSTGLFGGNSNWRGPIWMPVNVLLIEALAKLSLYYGDTFKVECPTGSGVLMTLDQVAVELSRRLQAIFLRAEGRNIPVDQRGSRPVYGGTEKFQHDPYWRDLILFYEYFHGDNGAGIGASHQTGWTGAIARLIQTTGIGEGNRFSFNLKPSAKQGKKEPRPASATR
jgi:hypothetical protein